MTLIQGRNDLQCDHCGRVEHEDGAVGWIEVRGAGVVRFADYFGIERHYCCKAHLSDALTALAGVSKAGDDA